MKEPTAPRATRKLATAVATAVGLAAFAAASPDADAGLMIDLRAVAVNGVPTSEHKAVLVSGAGDVVSINVYAVVSGTNSLNDEAFRSITGVFRSETGGLLGDLSAALVAPFNGLGSQAGSQIDIDGDGDFDIGAAPNGGQANMFFVARNDGATAYPDGTPLAGADPAAEEFLIGTMTFTVKGGFGYPFITFIRRRNPGDPGSDNVAYATWNEDGTGSASVRNGQDPYSVSPIRVPEPGSAAAAITSLTALGLLSRRRARGSEHAHGK